MRCQYNSSKICNDCDEHLATCKYCEHMDSDGDCSNYNSRYYGECMDGITVCCKLYEEKK